jgi:hypothetical protein
MRGALNQLRKKGVDVTLSAVRGSHHQIAITLPDGTGKHFTLSQKGTYGKRTSLEISAFVQAIEAQLDTAASTQSTTL